MAGAAARMTGTAGAWSVRAFCRGNVAHARWRAIARALRASFRVKRAVPSALPPSVTTATTLVPGATLNAPLASSLSPAGSSWASCLSLPASSVSLALALDRSRALPWSET